MPEDRPFIFKAGSTELVLPVTPGSYQVETGVNIEIVNIHQLGDVAVTGYATLATIRVDCLLPANSYPFAGDSDPASYLEQFEKWIKAKRQVRFIVGGTGVNIPVKIQCLQQGERDGTNDVYAVLTLREHRQLEPVQLTAPGENGSREEPEDQAPSEQLYTIVYGDTLSGICRKFYGDASANAYNRLAKYNGISNPHLIYAGDTLRIPKPLP